MNNSDHNDFKNWQNGDDEDGNNPNNHGFFFYGNMGPEFNKMWNDINSGKDFTDSMKDYLNMDDIMKDWGNNYRPKNPINNRRSMKKSQPIKTTTATTFSREDYEKLIEIRGYLNITEQRAHVKALDKLLNQIVIVPIDPKEKP